MLSGKLRKAMAKRTTIFCITGASLMGISILGTSSIPPPFPVPLILPSPLSLYREHQLFRTLSMHALSLHSYRASLTFLPYQGLFIYYFHKSAAIGLSVAFLPIIFDLISAVVIFFFIIYYGNRKADKRSESNQRKFKFVRLPRCCVLCCLRYCFLQITFLIPTFQHLLL